jgi:hypothetical protein
MPRAFRAPPGGTVTRLFGTRGAALVVSDRVCVGQRGVHGVALDRRSPPNGRCMTRGIVIQA